jgi:hypothetical protein
MKDYKSITDDFQKKLENLHDWGNIRINIDDKKIETTGIADYKLADLFAKSHGYKEIGTNWIQLIETEFVPTLKWVITADLAYGGGISAEDADEIVNELLFLFGKEYKCYTNGLFPVVSGHYLKKKDRIKNTWASLTDETFDACFLITNDSLTALIVSSAED